MATVLAIPTAAKAYQAAPLEVELGESDAQQVAARTAIAYGDSGLGKSTNARFFAQWMFERTGKAVRLVSAEDSSKLVFQPLIEVGIVQPLFLTRSQSPLVLLRKLAKGEWAFKRNPKSDTIEWVSLEKWQGEVSAYIIEGLTSICEQLLEDARENHRFLREQKTDAFEIGGEKFATASQTAYGFVQSEALRALKGFGMLPVDRVLWTAHETKGSEEDTKAPIRGPALVGSARTASIQKYCGTLLHFDGIQSEQTANGQKVTVVRPRVWFKRHPDPLFPNIHYPAKTTIPVEQIKELDKIFPGGFFDPGTEYGAGLDKFFNVEANLLKSSADALAKWKKQVEEKLRAQK